jgi:hypothetical protein
LYEVKICFFLKPNVLRRLNWCDAQWDNFIEEAHHWSWIVGQLAAKQSYLQLMGRSGCPFPRFLNPPTRFSFWLIFFILRRWEYGGLSFGGSSPKVYPSLSQAELPELS